MGQSDDFPRRLGLHDVCNHGLRTCRNVLKDIGLQGTCRAQEKSRPKSQVESGSKTNQSRCIFPSELVSKFFEMLL